MSSSYLTLLNQEYDRDPVLTHNMELSSPFVIICDHAGKAVPNRLENLGISESQINQHIGWDVSAWEISVNLADLMGAVAIGQHYSRLVIDCNRQIGTTDSISTMSDGVKIPGNNNLSTQEKKLRQKEIFSPYHSTIENLLAKQSNDFKTCIICIHSFTPQLLNGSKRPWQIGVISHPDEPMKTNIIHHLQSATDYEIGDDQPYQISAGNDYSMQIHGKLNGFHAIEFEFRNDVFRTEKSQNEICLLIQEAVEMSYFAEQNKGDTI